MLLGVSLFHCRPPNFAFRFNYLEIEWLSSRRHPVLVLKRAREEDKVIRIQTFEYPFPVWNKSSYR